MSIRNKTKGVKMKSKVALAVVAVLGIFFVQPAEANQGKSLVIIDSYFDSRSVKDNVVCITLSSNTPCIDERNAKIASPLSSNVNHGNAMIEVAKKQNPNIKIIALKSAGTSTADVNAGNFLEALKWINNNSSNIGAVSISRNLGTTKGSECIMPVRNIDAKTGDQQIRSLISVLSQKNIPIFAATGNTFGSTKIDYPACISSVNAVTAPGLADNTTVKYSADLVTLPGIGNNFSSTLFNLIPLTTSTATVAVATQYLVNGISPIKLVKVNA
jgi:hypothetical protein